MKMVVDNHDSRQPDWPARRVTTPEQRPSTTLGLRELLLDVWGRQACQNPGHWPEVQARLLKANDATRTSYRNRVDAAVEAFAAVTHIDADVVWRAFSPLDRAHCAELAGLIATTTRTSPT